MLRDLGEKVSKDNKDKIEKAIKELRGALDGKDISGVKAKMGELSNVLQEAGAAMYQQAGQQQGQQQQGQRQQEGQQQQQQDQQRYPGDQNKGQNKSSPKGGEDVVDAEFKEVNDEDK